MWLVPKGEISKPHKENLKKKRTYAIERNPGFRAIENCREFYNIQENEYSEQITNDRRHWLFTTKEEVNWNTRNA